MRDSTKNDTPSSVPPGAIQDGEVRARWPWTEPSVWTERMLTALENGVKGGKWYSLIDKVTSPRNLEAAWKRAERNRGAAGIDGQSVESFSAQAPANLQWLHEQLRKGQYVPSPVRRKMIPKPGSSQLRPLGIPTVRDRIVQGALKNVLEPIFEKEFVDNSLGFRPGCSAMDALRRVDELLGRGYTHVVDADIEAFFDRVDHGLLRVALEARIADRRVLALLEALIRQPVREGEATWTPTMGTPQGSVLSPLLANLYLHPVDVAMRAAGIEMVRYADDLVLMCESAEAAQAAHKLLVAELQKLKLTLHPTKTRVVHVDDRGGFEFLGYQFEKQWRRPRRKSWKKFREGVRELTPRASGHSLQAIVETLNRLLRGWYEYFKYAAEDAFKTADGFVRRRLRAILSRRRGASKRYGSGAAHKRWPNAFFADHGLYSCSTASALARQAR